MEILHHYNEDHNTTSALQIVPYIKNDLGIIPKSIIDVGCGVGQWLRVFRDMGCENVLGIDGEHVEKEKLMIDYGTQFKPYDLRKIGNLNMEKKFDIALNLEVAEHLPESSADDLIQFLTNVSDTIVFSAAIVGQTGENHVNEQNPDYWESKFKERGFVMLDAFREKFWNDAKVNWWYRQNMYLVVNEKTRGRYPHKEFKNFYVHPELFAYKESYVR
jgi:SAM-dependent methyltransferase